MMSLKRLPITKIVFYKHGVGFFERQGEIGGEKNLKLSFKKKDMNDILKSLVVLDRSPDGQVVSISYDTQEDVAEIIRDKSINLAPSASLRDLLKVLRGYEVTLKIKGEEVKGTVVGVDYSETRKNLSDNLLSLYVTEEKRVLTYSLSDIIDFTVNDDTADSDLRFFLEKSIAERKKDERFVTVVLDGTDHDLLVNYIASSPTWRVSYRLIYESEKKNALFMGWGIVNNTLEEDLEDVKLVLTTGMPISFVYDLYTPTILERPSIEDKARPLAAPVVLEKSDFKKKMKREMAPPKAQALMKTSFSGFRALEDAEADMCLSDNIASKTALSATGEKEGQFFKYNISKPVTIKRGQSAMVPILSLNFDCVKEHVYTSGKGEKNPYVTVKFKNNSSFIFERGPVTVVEDGSYVGEAIVPFVSKDQEVRLPFAVDVEVSVKEEFFDYDVMNSLSFNEYEPGNQYFHKEVYHIAQRTYKASNDGDDDIDLIIEHRPYGTSYELFETEEPVEKTENYLRWKITVPSCDSVTLVVQERTKLYRYEYYENLTMETLAEWLKEKYMDKATHKQLKSIFKLHEEIRKIEEKRVKIEEKTEEVLEQQQSLIEQLDVLKEKGEEGTLRNRYVKKLGKLEDQKENLVAQNEEFEQKIIDIKVQIDEVIKGLVKDI